LSFANDIYRAGEVGGGQPSMPILSLYSIVICVVAAVLYVAINEHEPDRRLAFALKIFIVIVVVAAIVRHWMR
jgi:hypothetical protein